MNTKFTTRLGKPALYNPLTLARRLAKLAFPKINSSTKFIEVSNKVHDYRIPHFTNPAPFWEYLDLTTPASFDYWTLMPFRFGGVGRKTRVFFEIWVDFNEEANVCIYHSPLRREF